MEDAKLISRNSLFQLVNSAVQDYLNPRRLALCMKTYKSTTGDRTLTRRGRALRENGGSGGLPQRSLRQKIHHRGREGRAQRVF